MRIVLPAAMLVIAGLLAACSIQVDDGTSDEVSIAKWCEASLGTQDLHDEMRSVDLTTRRAFEPQLREILRRFEESEPLAPQEVRQDFRVLIQHTEMWIDVMDVADWGPDVLVARTPQTRRSAFQVNLFNLENCGVATDF